MTARPDHDQLERDRRISRLYAAIMDGDHEAIDRAIAEMHEAAIFIANSRPRIRGRLLDALNQETQADYDEEREFGWSVSERGAQP